MAGDRVAKIATFELYRVEPFLFMRHLDSPRLFVPPHVHEAPLLRRTNDYGDWEMSECGLGHIYTPTTWGDIAPGLDELDWALINQFLSLVTTTS